jgi:hypothetical protein
MAKVALFSSFTFSYLSRALVLLRTAKRVHPDWEFWALMVDRPPPDLDLDDTLAGFDHVIYADALRFERYSAWLFKHDIVEACTAVKGQMIVHLLESGYNKVIYLDPDIAIFHPMDDIINKLNNYSIILTPHQAEPNEDYGVSRDNELTSMKYGIYNLGFVAVRNDENGMAFGRWWARNLYEACYDDIANGLFTDQKYCDLVPGLFAKVFVERDPGCNLASWNLTRRKVSITNGGDILVNGSPLKFYHFTKINTEGDIMTEKYAGDNVEVIEVWNWYKRTIESATIAGMPARYWYYGNFSNGEKITKAARVLFRTRADLYRFFENPFQIEGDSSFYNWLAREEPALLAGK